MVGVGVGGVRFVLLGGLVNGFGGGGVVGRNGGGGVVGGNGGVFIGGLCELM